MSNQKPKGSPRLPTMGNHNNEIQDQNPALYAQSVESLENQSSFLENIRVMLQNQIPRYIDEYMEKFHSQIQTHPSVIYQDSTIPQSSPVYLSQPGVQASHGFPQRLNQC
jgi:hypothetical protein